jgi:hypothetical protein
MRLLFPIVVPSGVALAVLAYEVQASRSIFCSL